MHANAKRKSPPPASPSNNKRQRIDSPGGSAPLATLSSFNSPGSASPDTLSTLSEQSHPSSPEVELSLAAQQRVSNEEAPAITSESPAAVHATTAVAGDDDEEEEEDEDEEDEDGNREGPHHDISSKTLPSHQPRPLGSKATGASKSGPLRPTVGGKGKKGEEALEHAVAAREEVERRRVELKGGAKAGPPGPGSANGLSKTLKAGHSEKLGEDSVRVKVEEEEDATVEDAKDEGVPTKREKPAFAEERANIIRFPVVTNDQSPESLIILTGLKNIFQKQLPKMPREYIARLVYDRNHYSMAIVKRGLEVVGGVTYRPFEARKFAEIVFFAITGTEQVKGYGAHLMNHLKDHVKATTACMHFLTYADNYAIGYFKKQGFTKEVGLDRSVWAGYIKDYEGGTIMHCAMLERLKYMEVASILSQQKEVILSEIRQNSQSHVVHAGLSLFQTLEPGASLDPVLVPGLKESGWTPEMDVLTRRPVRGPQFAIMQRLHTLLVDHPNSWAFAQPVNGAEVTDYYKVILHPMDLSTMESKLESNLYSNLSEFVADAKLIFDNCRAYNDAGSNYVKNANKLEAYLMEQVKLYDVD